MIKKIIKKIKKNKKFIKNFYKRNNYEKAPRVLLSYIIKPFIEGVNFKHSNTLEALTATQVFDELGYIVDIINFNSIQEVDYSKYDVVYGFGNPLEKVFFYKDNKKIHKIFYGTGCSPFYSNLKGIKRFKETYDNKNILLHKSLRLVKLDYNLQLTCSDAIISLGNQFVADTYKSELLSKEIFPLKAFYFDIYNINLEEKDFKKAKKHFLWFGSLGLIHKGLDIALDVFKNRKDITLHICGANPKEKDFFKYYNNELNNKLPNIINHGFIDIKGEKFKELMNLCGATILPTASEGGAVSLLNVMANGGFIPITSKFSSIDIESFGFIMEKLDNNSLEEKINEYLDLSLDEMKKLSKNAKDTIRKGYSYDKYKENLKKHITEILKYQ